MDKIFTFRPYLKSVIWGGEKIAALKGIEVDEKNIGESWEISGVAGHESVVDSGSDAGLNLRQLIEKYGAALVGKHVYEHFGAEFPLLVKILDAKADLSVQVHPDDALAARRHGCQGKTEMWYIMDVEPDARIYAGLDKAITPDEYEQLVEEKKIMDVVASHASAPGDVFFLPAGRIHAIGAGNLLAEIQQTSDITYRVYDYDRRDAAGNPRELHTTQARDAIDYTVYPDYLTHYDRNAADGTLTPLVACPYFDVRLLRLGDAAATALSDTSAAATSSAAATEVTMPVPVPDSFTIVVCTSGTCTLTADGEQTLILTPGTTALVAATATSLRLSGTATLLLASVPTK